MGKYFLFLFFEGFSEMKKILMLCAVFLILAACTLNIFAEPYLSTSEARTEPLAAAENYDFSLAAPESSLTLLPSELLSIFTASEPSAEELEFVDKNSTLEFSYTPSVPTESVKILSYAGSDSLLVYANTYTQTKTANGVDVTWTPKTASSDGISAEFSENNTDGYGYKAVLSIGNAESVFVSYEATFSFSAEAVREICTLAYKRATAAAEKIAEENARYDALLAEYNNNCALHRKYLSDLAEYEAKLPVYEAYAAECERILAAYNKELEEYNAVLSEYEERRLEYERLYAEYEAKLAAYNTYINVTKPTYDREYAEYIAYLNAKEEFDVEWLLYEAYLEEAKTYLYQLSIINASKVPMTLDRTLYDAITGTTVTQVLERANEIKDAIPNGSVPITKARQATVRLRNFYASYFAAASDEARYICYSSNYAKGYYVKKSVTELLQALDFLYEFDAVYNMLAEQDKSHKYAILLAQLYITAAALSDEPIYNYEKTAEFTDSYTWKYVDSQGKTHTATPLQILEGERYIEDKGTGTPLSAPFPEEVAKPEEPELAICPEPVEKLAEPIPPTALEAPPASPDEPTMPPEVEKPVCPDPVPEPTKPEPYLPSEEELFLKGALDGGKIVFREDRNEDFVLKRSAELCKKISPEDGAFVYFYSDKSDAEPLFVSFVKLGKTAQFPLDTPTRESDEKYHYSFEGWQYSDGTSAELENLGTGHIYLYPVFKKHDKNESFAVTWNIAGKTVLSYVKYGEMPVYSGGTPTREKDELYYYEFASWDREFEPVFSEAEYTAVFTPLRYYKITWLLRGEPYAVCDVLSGEIPTAPMSPTLPDDSFAKYTFAGWGTLEPAFEDRSYEAEFDITRYYKIYWKFDGAVLAQTNCLETEIPTPPIEIGTVLLDDGDVQATLEAWDSELVPPSADCSYEAQCSYLNYYTVRFMHGDEILFSERCLEYTIPTPPTPPSDYEDELGIYVFRSWDKAVDPVVCDCDYIAVFDLTRIFCVEWYSDGELLYSERYKEGETPSYRGELPTRVNDSLYKYSFFGWDKPCEPVSADTVYSARYSAEYIFPLGTSGAALSYSYGRITADITDTGTCEIKRLDELLSLAQGRRITIKTEGLTLDITFETASRIVADGGRNIILSSEDGELSFTVTDGDGETVDGEYSASISFPSSSVPTAALGGVMHFVKCDPLGSYEIIPTTVGTGAVFAESVLQNTTYKYVEFFEINVSAGAEFLSVKALASAGERVELSFDIPEGMKLSGVYYIIDGNSSEKISVLGNSFIMPSSDIRLSASTSPIVFSVKFVLFDGLVIERKCPWGTVPTAPEPPVGADSEYSYTFVSWDAEIVPVYEDLVYTAEYEKKLLPKEEEGERNLLLSYLVTVYRFRVLLMVFSCLAILSVPALVFFKKYRKKHPIS